MVINILFVISFLICLKIILLWSKNEVTINTFIEKGFIDKDIEKQEVIIKFRRLTKLFFINTTILGTIFLIDRLFF